MGKSSLHCGYSSSSNMASTLFGDGESMCMNFPRHGEDIPLEVCLTLQTCLDDSFVQMKDLYVWNKPMSLEDLKFFWPVIILCCVLFLGFSSHLASNNSPNVLKTSEITHSNLVGAYGFRLDKCFYCRGSDLQCVSNKCL